MTGRHPVPPNCCEEDYHCTAAERRRQPSEQSTGHRRSSDNFPKCVPGAEPGTARVVEAPRLHKIHVNRFQIGKPQKSSTVRDRSNCGFCKKSEEIAVIEKEPINRDRLCFEIL